MKEGKFKELIKFLYSKSKSGTVTGVLFTTARNIGFSQIEDIDEILKTVKVDMLYVKSQLTGTDIEVFSWEIVDFKIKHSEDTVYIKVKNKQEVPIMY